MAKRDRKVPKNATKRSGGKSVRIVPSQLPDFPSWQFSTVDTGGPFAWPVGQDVELQILNKLRQFDGMKWNEIAGRTHHAIKLDDLSKEAKKRLQDTHRDDIEEVFSFALNGRPRVICIRDNNIAKLLWWDPEHLVCPSKIKHT